MTERLSSSSVIGHVVCPPNRPATPREVWIDLLSAPDVALNDLLVVQHQHQRVLGTVIDLQKIDPSSSLFSLATTQLPLSQPLPIRTIAKLSILSTSDFRLRPPQGSRVRRPTAEEVTLLLAEARAIPPDKRVPVGVIKLHDGLAPVFCHADRVIGPLATSMLISGAAGSIKSTAGMLLVLGLQHRLQGRIAAVIINSKGADFLFADHARDTYSADYSVPPLRPDDYAIYSALGFSQPPILNNTTVWVPDARDPLWRSVRPVDYAQTRSYRISHASGLRYALARNDDDERATSAITRQCIEEAAGPFATEQGITTLTALTTRLEHEFLTLSSERARWRNQFQGTTLAAALRQLQTTVRDLGPLLAEIDEPTGFPVADLVCGGTWVIDVAHLPQRAAQVVIDEVIHTLWNAKATGVIPHQLPLILLIDELNRWSTTGPTASRLAAIVRDQRHRRFGIIGLAQQLSTLHPQILANTDAFWYGITRSQEAMSECYAHLAPHIRLALNRLAPGERILEAWPFAEPLRIHLPYPSWLISDEGQTVVEQWKSQ